MTDEEYSALLEQLKTDKELAERLKKDSVSILIGPDDSNNAGAEGPTGPLGPKGNTDTEERIKKLENEVLFLRNQNALFGANMKTEDEQELEEKKLKEKIEEFIRNRR